MTTLRYCLFLLAALPLHGADWPVRDAAEIAEAMKKAAPGDTLVMRAGTWTDQHIVFKGLGTAEKPITLGTATPGGTVLDGTSRLQIAGSYLVVDGLWFKGARPAADVIEFRASSKFVADHCTLRNTALTACNTADLETTQRWVSIYGDHNVVESCYLADKRNAGTTLVVWVDPARPNEHIIRRNHFGPRPRLGKNGGETVRVGDSETSNFNSRTLVEGNLFERCNGEVEIISNKSCENIYRGNTFLGCEGALTLRHGKRCVVDGNFFMGRNEANTGGVRIIDEGHVIVNNYFSRLLGDGARSALTMMNGRVDSPLNGYFQVRGAVVAFNTFMHCKDNILIGLADGSETLAPTGCTIANNIITGSGGSLVKVATPPENFVWEGNLFADGSVGVTAEGITQASARMAQDPDGVWRPTEKSPAIDGAKGDYPQVTTDLDGQPRPATGRDIGADEASDEQVRSRLLRPKDIGPGWMGNR